MRRTKHDSSILPVRFHYSRDDIERIAVDELRQAQCLPGQPAEVDVGEYLLVRHGITPQCAPFPEHVMGLADLLDPRHPRIFIACHVADSWNEHRYRSTEAHEAAHVILHSHLYLEPDFTAALSLWRGGGDARHRTMTCLHRDVHEAPRRYNPADPFAHLEHQANLAMASLLCPRPLVRRCVAPWTATQVLRDGSRTTTLAPAARNTAVEAVSRTFNVSRQLAAYRLEELYPQ